MSGNERTTKNLEITSDGLYQELNAIKRDINRLSEELQYFNGKIHAELRNTDKRIDRFWYGVGTTITLSISTFTLLAGYLISNI